MFIQFVIILFSFYTLSRVFIRYKRKELSSRETLLWVCFWILVISATLRPKTTDIIAKYFGVSRGADLLVYISIIVIFFLVFKIIVKMEKIDRDITRIVRREAIEKANKIDLPK